jgi:hypothetical protein
MSHYRYILEGDEAKKKKPRTITAKTEAAAREAIAKQYKDPKIISFVAKIFLKKTPAPNTSIPCQKAENATKTTRSSATNPST